MGSDDGVREEATEGLHTQTCTQVSNVHRQQKSKTPGNTRLSCLDKPHILHLLVQSKNAI